MFSRSPVRIQPGECHDVTQSYVRQYDTVVRDFLPLWNRVLSVSARETNDIGPQC